MKIFAVHNSFNPGAGNCLPAFGDCTDVPVIYEMPDTALLKNNRPFFIPDYADPCSYQGSLVIRISRLGRYISPRFAHRYYDACTLGIGFTAENLFNERREKGLPWDVSKGFDNAAVIGDFIELNENTDAEEMNFRIEENDEPRQSGNVRGRFAINDIVAYISRFYLLRQGDLIYTGFPCTPNIAHTDSHIVGYLNEKKVFAFNIK